MTLYSVVGIISTVTLSLPILIILALRLTWYKSFPALLAYYIIAFSYNLFWLNYIKTDSNFVHYYGLLNNFLDIPLMLTFITYFSPTALFRRRMRLGIYAFLLFEIVVIAFYGLGVRSMTIILAPGLVTMLVLSLLFFIHQAKITVIHQKAAGKAFMVSAVLFAYGGYSFLYIVYYLMKTTYKTDSYLVYFLVTIFSSLLISMGIFFERRRVKQLAEVQTTRKELKLIYGGAGSDSSISERQAY